MTLDDEYETDPLLEEAAEWLLHLQESPHDPALTGRFEAWLARSPEHARAWEKMRRSWQLIGEVAPAHETSWRKDGRKATSPAMPTPYDRPRHATSHRRGRPNWHQRFAGMAAIAACAVFLVFAAPSFLLRFDADHMTGTAESRVVTLEDGSTVTLGAGSAIAANIGTAGRHVSLLGGEAFFEVAHDAGRPFTVEAGEVTVSVLGTAFDMQLSAVTAMVQLAEGSVDVSYERDGRTGAARLAPGEMVRIDRRTGDISRNAIAQDEIAAWRNGQLFVSDASIGAVVEQLQRYHPAWIKVVDGDLADQRVTGLYDLRDPDRALRALVQPYGGHVHALSPYLRVLSRF